MYEGDSWKSQRIPPTFQLWTLAQDHLPNVVPISGVLGELVSSKGASLGLSAVPLHKAEVPTAASLPGPLCSQ